MKLTGKCYCFARKRTLKNGEEVTSLSTSVTDKDKEGNVNSRFYYEIRFAGEKAPSAKKLNKLEENTLYEIELKDAFLSCRSYEKDGAKFTVPQIVILDATITDSQKIDKKKKDDKPKKKKEKEETDEDDDEMPF